MCAKGLKKIFRDFIVGDPRRWFAKGDIVKVSLVVERVAMRVGELYVLGGLADKSGLLWYETKFSKLLAMEANKGVGPMIMKCDWQLDKKG